LLDFWYDAKKKKKTKKYAKDKCILGWENMDV
jgi:hypothetical protein